MNTVRHTSNKKVTASDVAARAGVSKWTVSRAFTDGASIAPEVRERSAHRGAHGGGVGDVHRDRERALEQHELSLEEWDLFGFGKRAIIGASASAVSVHRPAITTCAPVASASARGRDAKIGRAHV